MEIPVKISSATQPYFARLMNDAALFPAGQNESLLDQVLAALQEDEYILRRLRDTVDEYGRIVDQDPILEESIAICAELRIGCRLAGAYAALKTGAPEKARQFLGEVGIQSPALVPEILRPFAFYLLVSIAWTCSSQAQAGVFLGAAEQIDTSGQYRPYLQGLKRLFAARDATADGNHDRAVRLCHALLRETDAGHPLQILALELMSDAFGKMGDIDGEFQALQSWESKFADRSNGPCDDAVTSQFTDQAPGVWGGDRSQEILSHYSRLAMFYEQTPATYPQARTIYHHFLNTAYHNWIDPRMPERGAIVQRLARLDRYDIASDPDDPTLTNMAVFEPERSFGRISEEQIKFLRQELSILPAGWMGSAIAHRPEIKERHFKFSSERGHPAAQLFQALRDLCTPQDPNQTTFIAQQVHVHWNHHHEQWVLLAHNQRQGDLSRLSFGIQATPIGDTLDLSVYTLFTCETSLTLADEPQLVDFLSHRPEEWSGYQALQSQVLELIKRSARRLSQHGTNHNADATGSEGIREL